MVDGSATPGILTVGGGDDRWGVGGVGVRTGARIGATWEDGGGVIEEVFGGAGDTNLALSGVRAIGMADGAGDVEASWRCGVVGPKFWESSVVDMSEACAACESCAWTSILFCEAPMARLGGPSPGHVRYTGS